MNFTVYDSLSRRKQPLFEPGSKQLKLYVCGPTVYDRVHIGNARTYAIFMALVRYLRFCGAEVKYVSNITDVNDKIYAAAKAEGMSSTELAKQATEWYKEDTSRIGLGRPDLEPLVSDSIAPIISLIEDLIAKDLAYESKGDVYFRVEGYSAYGKLSNQQVEEMLAASRVEDSGQKDRPLDFALWKASKGDEDTSWDSPWGKGRPGWHIECSAMAEAHLGAGFDVHGGGLDLIFPHHENEVAQSCGAGRPFARLWMHGGMLEFDGEKMSKSEGNIESLQEVLEKWPAWAVILFFFSALYRNPLNFSDTALEDAVKQGTRITEALRRSERYLASVITRDAGDPTFADSTHNWEGIHEALQEDFNTPIAMSEVFGLVHDLNTAVNEHATPQIVRNLRLTIMEFLELFSLSDLLPQAIDLSDEATDLLEQRELARKKKNFEESDRIRDLLLEMGYVVRDTGDGVDVVGVGDEDDDSDASDVEGDVVTADAE